MSPRSLLVLFALLTAGCAARQPHSGSTELISAENARALAIAHREAGAAYFDGDFSRATRAFTRILELNPGADSTLYTLAHVAAEGGRPEEAYRWLERLVSMRSDLVPVVRDFPGLSGDRFDEIVKALAKNGPQKHGEVAFTIDERDLIPEGIAHDPVKDTFFVSSIRKRKVVAIRADGSIVDFIAPGAHGLMSTLGMKVDPERRHLWVASWASGSMEGFTDAERGSSILFRFDADTGALLARYPRTTPGTHLLNDLVLDAEGNVYVTDSEAGEVLKLGANAPEGDAFEVIVPPGEVFYPNGIALSGDGSTLYVADFVQGLTAVRLPNGERELLRHPLGVTTRDIDGMYFRDGSLFAVQNGTGAGRITRFVLSAEGDHVVRAEVLEANHPDFITPTTGVIKGDALYVIANAQLRSFDADGKLWPAEKLHPVRIVRVPLGEPALRVNRETEM